MRVRVKLLLFVYFITIAISIVAIVMSSIVQYESNYEEKTRRQLYRGEIENLEWQTNVEVNCVEEFEELRKPDYWYVEFGENCVNATNAFFEKWNKEHPARGAQLLETIVYYHTLCLLGLISNFCWLMSYLKHAQSPLNYNNPEYYRKKNV